MTRTRSALGFGVILGATFAGALHASGWFACATAAALVLLSLNNHNDHYGRFANSGNLSAQSALLFGSVLNAATASVVAYGLGRAIGWLWVV
jgi:hypothetical protein